MATNEQQVSQRGAVDFDGFPFSGLLVPSATGGIVPGGVPLGPDGNSDDYAAQLVVPVQPGNAGQNVPVTTATQSAYTATIAALAGRLNYLSGVMVSLNGQIGANATHVITLTGLSAIALVLKFTLLTTESPKPIIFSPPLAIPASAVNTAIVATLTNQAGGNVAFSGILDIWGFSRPA